MRITETRNTQSKSPARGARASGAEGRFSLPAETSNTSGASRASETGPLGAVDGLLALQGVGGERRRAAKNGADVLNLLDRLRLEILSGGVTPARLNEIGDAAARARTSAADPDLAEVLAEIDLRARVELAKRSGGM